MVVVKFFFKLVLAVVVVFAALAGYVYYEAHRPQPSEQDPLVINDATGLKPVRVNAVVKPQTEQEIIDALSLSQGPVSIGGARYSMGGQTSFPDSLHFDMRDYDEVVAFDPETKLITVQSGITWKQVQQYIDPHNLSVSVMQDFNNFTVGGSLSVNAHGRNIRTGAIINTVKSIRLVLADGSVYQASPLENDLLFYGAIGGYGGLGVITEATLQLVDNIPIERATRKIHFTDYLQYFNQEIANDEQLVFHNALLYPPHYETLLDISWRETDKPLTERLRLKVTDRDNWWKPVIVDWIAQSNFLKRLRQSLIDPYRLQQPAVAMRNFESSHDMYDYGFFAGGDSHLAVREYFVPLDSFEVFVLKMRDAFIRYQVDVLNITVRFVPADRKSFLSWANEDMLSLLVVFRQEQDAEAAEREAEWSRRLIEGAIESGGSFYMPFHINQTQDQFVRAYPNAGYFFDLKRRADPQNRFISHLWLEHYPENLALKQDMQNRSQQAQVDTTEEPFALPEPANVGLPSAVAAEPQEDQ
ncbi:MAG: FAD-binding oxidoreductase [Gammaproteobacteria bacterium]|nr:FAD-binding oxidoreductase [Gammaproteobacteria bacterium]